MVPNVVSNSQTKKDQEQNIIPITVWVQFENEQIGKNHRNKNSYLYSNIKIHHNWTPIYKINDHS